MLAAGENDHGEYRLPLTSQNMVNRNVNNITNIPPTRHQAELESFRPAKDALLIKFVLKHHGLSRPLFYSRVPAMEHLP